MARRPRPRLDVLPLEGREVPAVFTWDGGGANPNWSTPANWDGDVAPTAAGASTVVVFRTAVPASVQDVAGLTLDQLRFDPGADVQLTLNQDLGLLGAAQGGATQTVTDTTGLNEITGAGRLVLAGRPLDERGPAVFGTSATSGTLLVSARLTGPRGFVKQGAGTLTLAPAGGSNDFAGAAQVADGVLVADAAAANAALPTPVTVGDGAGAASSAVLRLGRSEQVADGATLTVNADGQVEVPAGATETVTGLAVNDGRVAVEGTLALLSGGTVTAAGALAVGGAVTGTGALNLLGTTVVTTADSPAVADLTVSARVTGAAGAGLIKAGPGRLTLTAANTYPGTTTVNAGTLEVLGSQPQSAVALAGGVLGGSGQVGPLTVTAGVVQPGLPFTGPPATLRTGNLSATGGAFAPRLFAPGRVDIGGAAQENDRLAVTGTVALAGLTLAPTRPEAPVPAGTALRLIDNDGTDPVAGTFAGLPEGSTLSVNGQGFTLSYVGGDGNDVVLTAQGVSNLPPTISDIADRTVPVNGTTGPIPFAVGDPDGTAAAVAVTATASDGTLVPAANIVLGGSGAARTITVTAAGGLTGSATVTVVVTDSGGATAADTFVVTVSAAANTPPTVSDIADRTILVGGTTGAIPFTVGDAETPAGSLTVSAVSSNPALVPPGGLVLGGSGADRTLTVNPAAGQSGTAAITVNVTDAGGATTSRVFQVAVSGVANSPPTVTVLPPTVRIPAGAASVPLAFTVGDAATPAGSLTVTATSSNPALVPQGGLVLAGTGADRTLTITPAAGQTGTATVTLNVSDNAGGVTTRTVQVTVEAASVPFQAGGVAGGSAVVFAPTAGQFAATLTLAYAGLTGDARVATADVTGDGTPDYIAGSGPGGTSRVVVIDGRTNALVASFDVFEAAFTGGVFVAAADLNGDGRAEVVVTPDRGGGPVVAVYSGAGLAGGQNAAAQVARFFGIEDPNFRGGARPAVGDVNGDGRADLLVAAGFGGGPRLALFDGRQVLAGGGGLPPKLVGDFFVFEQTLRNGVFVAAGDLNGDGAADVVVGGGPGGGPRVFAVDGRTLAAGGGQQQVANFFAGDPSLRGGVRVAVRPGADGTPALVTGSGENEPARVRVYKAATARAAGVASSPDQELQPFAGATLADGVFVG